MKKKSTPLNPDPMPETKTPAKGGVNASVDQVSGKEKGKVFVGKTESGSFQVSGLKEAGVSENVAKLSDKAQEAFSPADG